MELFGFTRSTVHSNYALLAPDSHIPARLHGWSLTDAVVLISPQMGSTMQPRFSQYLARMEPGGRSGLPLPNVERFAFVLEGRICVKTEASVYHLTPGGYVFFPANCEHTIEATTVTRLNVFEKPWSPLPGAQAPAVVVGQEQEVESVPFLGDPDLLLRTLLPSEPAFDMAINIMCFNPGATLPMVEVHIMEHGLLMLGGQGIQRLADSWYPVTRGDVVWMAPYCPQWFVAMGKERACYLLYKNINRDPLEGLVPARGGSHSQ